jgi:hypothetical protein
MIRPIVLIFALSMTLSSTFAADQNRPFCPNCPPDDPNGDVFEPESCVGPTITSAEAAAKFCRGDSQVELANFKYAARVRNCNTFTKCGDWRPLDPTKGILLYDNYGSGGQIYGDGLSAGGSLVLRTLQDGVRVNFASLSFTSKSDGVLNFYTNSELPATAGGSTYVNGTYAVNLPGYLWATDTKRSAENGQIDVQFTDHCARFLTEFKSAADASATWSEIQFGGLARYSPNFRQFHRPVRGPVSLPIHRPRH